MNQYTETVIDHFNNPRNVGIINVLHIGISWSVEGHLRKVKKTK